ncbi:MAG: hypothetical protein QOE35_1714 [Actinomycetota bacterium]
MVRAFASCGSSTQEEADQLAEFDIKKLTTSELVMLGGAVAVFIGTFLAWFKVDLAGFGGGSVNGFHYFLQGTIPWILAIAVAAVIIIKAFVPNVKLPDSPGPVTWGQAYLIACGVIAFLILTRIISVDGPSEIVTRGIGLYLAFLGGAAMAVGAFLKFQAKEEDAPSGGSTPPTPF